MLLFLSSAYNEVRSLQSLDTSALYGDLRTVLPPSDCSADQLDSALPHLTILATSWTLSAPSDYPGDQLDSALPHLTVLATSWTLLCPV